MKIYSVGLDLVTCERTDGHGKAYRKIFTTFRVERFKKNVYQVSWFMRHPESGGGGRSIQVYPWVSFIICSWSQICVPSIVAWEISEDPYEEANHR
jgi:hypothetical protein